MGRPHEREHYRVAYPTKFRPVLLIQDREFDVVDLSESGIRFRLGSASSPEVGYAIQGTIHFRRGETIDVGGVVVRIGEGEVAVRLDEGIPLRVIMAEQRGLLDRRGFLGL